MDWKASGYGRKTISGISFPVNIMDQYHPDNFCDPGGLKHNKKYEEISRRTTSKEILQAFRYAKELDLNFQSISYEKNTTGLSL